MPDLDELARAAFAAYGEAVGGRNHQGQPIPAWEDLGEEIQGAWRAATQAVMGRCCGEE